MWPQGDAPFFVLEHRCGGDAFRGVVPLSRQEPAAAFDDLAQGSDSPLRQEQEVDVNARSPRG